MTLNCCKFKLSGNFVLVGIVWEATTGKRMKIDPHCQRGNCCTLKLLFNDVQITLMGDPKWGPIWWVASYIPRLSRAYLCIS